MSGSAPWTESQTSARAVIGCYWLFGSSPPLIIITDVRRGRDIQLNQQRPQTAAETTLLTVRLTLGVRGYGYCISHMQAFHTVSLLVCVVEMFHEVGHRFNHSSLVCILDRKVLFLFSELHFCHCCGSEGK